MRNVYTPDAGEVLVGNQLERFGWSVNLPTRDLGIDLLAERDGGFARVQVKESRTYDNINNPEVAWTSWTRLTEAQLHRATELNVDAFVFVVHAPVEHTRRQGFEILYVVISPDELDRRLRAYQPGADRTVYWHKDWDGRLWELRGKTARSAGANFRVPERDVTVYLNNWTTSLGGGPRGVSSDV